VLYGAFKPLAFQYIDFARQRNTTQEKQRDRQRIINKHKGKETQREKQHVDRTQRKKAKREMIEVID